VGSASSANEAECDCYDDSGNCDPTCGGGGGGGGGPSCGNPPPCSGSASWVRCGTTYYACATAVCYYYDDQCTLHGSVTDTCNCPPQYASVADDRSTCEG
jgi:hypothetical protein